MCNVSYAVSYLMEDSGINSDLLGACGLFCVHLVPIFWNNQLREIILSCFCLCPCRYTHAV